ncbi:hypothetical protein BDM02DRAFT_3030252 [Thelephora ganbajun]|uniref:Uncharacterized protein n=1 Tax=Thelephora ganbajun TaxID=370292 RepID=A0ACB6ZA63_THEGA|nr:hypothetical protein BDM02DRAFT_3030252 [Thelephora ganbajun]
MEVPRNNSNSTVTSSTRAMANTPTLDTTTRTTIHHTIRTAATMLTTTINPIRHTTRGDTISIPELLGIETIWIGTPRAQRVNRPPRHRRRTRRPRLRMNRMTRWFRQKSFKNWRADDRENLWTRGSRARTCGRFFCCTVMITVFLIISILLSLALWVKPPNVIVANPVQNDTQPFTFQNGELAFNLGANITVDNPNYFGVGLNKVELDLIYPINNYPVGGGVRQNINIKSNTQTNFTFPFSLNYNVSDTSGTAVLQDIVNKCRASQDLKVNYKLKLSLWIIIVSISPTITNSFTIGCPVDPAELEVRTPLWTASVLLC